MDATLIKRETIRHEANANGLRIGQVDYVQVGADIYLNNYWYQWETGTLHHIDCVKQ